MKYCPNCGKKIQEGAEVCLSCGKIIHQTGTVLEGRSKLVAGLLGIILGAWGIHSFYLGYTSKGIAQIIVTVITCGIGGLWGFIEGILIITGNVKVDADGIPLKD